MQKLIAIHGGVVRHPEWKMAAPIDFELLNGENIAIVGPNGGGKSMFVSILTGSHPLLGDAIEYDFSPTQKELVSDNIKYIQFHLPQEGELQEPDVEIELDDYRSYNRSKRSGLKTSK